MDGIYPKGFVIGQIESIERSAGEFSNVLIRPSVNLSALETVLVVTSPTRGAEGRQRGCAGRSGAREARVRHVTGGQRTGA